MALSAFKQKIDSQQAEYHAGIGDLETEVQELQARLAQERSSAEANLAQQTVEHARAVQEVDSHVAMQLSRLEELRQQRATALRREVAQSRQLIEDATLGAQRNLEDQLKEAKLVFNTRIQHEQARGEDTIQADLKAVTDAQRERQEWERRAHKMKENYRVHAVKSRTYVKSLDSGRRQQLVDLWAKG